MKPRTIALFASVVLAFERYVAVSNNDLIPRYFLDRSLPLAKRAGSCKEGNHPCEDTGFGNECCSNDHYCYVSSEGGSRCCLIGSNCPNDTECNSDSFQCTTTTTISGTSTEQEGCCPRPCTATSQYLCPSGEGGKCCGYDADCRGGNCIVTAKPSRSGELTPIAEGCTTRQYKCEDGNGCCDNDQSCTEVSGAGYCAAGRPTETDLEFIDDEGGSGGDLSDGAKAGIAVGAVVGAAAIIGIIVWMFLRKRREKRRAASAPSGGSDSQQRHEDAAGMTENSYSSRPQQTGRGLTQEYFGPAAVVGPYTETAGHGSNATSPGPHRAMPSGRPDNPGDIIAPVELDSEARTEEAQSIVSPTYYPSPPQQKTTEGRFELYQSAEVEPPPRSPSILQTPIAFKGRSEKEDER